MTKAMLNSWVDVTEDRKETLVDLRPVRNSDSLQPSVRPNVPVNNFIRNIVGYSVVVEEGRRVDYL